MCFNQQNGCVLHMNACAYAALLHFEKSSCVARVIVAVAEIFKAPADVVSADLLPVIVDMVDRGFLEVVN